MKREENRGQVTIFIVIALIIIVLGILVYMFYPKITSTLGITSENPQQFIQSCLEDQVLETIEKISSQGGSFNPGHYIIYNNEKIEYLCYTNEYYLQCVMQQPRLQAHVESEIQNQMQNSAKECFQQLKTNYENKGYNVNLNPVETSVEILPKKVVINFDSGLTLSKEDSETYDLFNVVVDNNLYELVSIASSILNWEARYGDAETTTYMNYYHDLKVEKKKQTDGTKIYILTNRDTLDKFQFATRSVVFPPGYG